MDYSWEQRLCDELRRLARDEPSHEIPTAAEVWSRSQFRLRYKSHKLRHSYASTASTAMVALYALLFLLWDTRSDSLRVGISLTLAVAIVAAFLLCWMSRRTVRS